MKASFSQKKIKILKQVLINNKNIKFLIAPLIIKQILQVEAMKQKLIILQIKITVLLNFCGNTESSIES